MLTRKHINMASLVNLINMWLRREDLNLRTIFMVTSLAVRRTRPGYATSPSVGGKSTPYQIPNFMYIRLEASRKADPASYFFLNPVGHLGLTPVTFLINLPLMQVMVEGFLVAVFTGTFVAAFS